MLPSLASRRESRAIRSLWVRDRGVSYHVPVGLLRRVRTGRVRVAQPGDGPLLLAGATVVLLFVAAIAITLIVGDTALTAGAVTAFVLVAITYPVVRWMARADRDPDLVWVLMSGLFAHLFGAIAIYATIKVAFDGVADANLYHGGGVSVFDGIRAGSTEWQLGETLEAFPPETERIGIIVGLLYVFTGPSVYAGFFAFSWFSYVGLVLMTRGLRWGMPNARHRRYEYIVMFLPSLLFWPGAIGKEAWMLLCLGFIAYGAGRILGPTPHFSGFVSVGVGITGATLIRPHVALVAAGALGVALLASVLGGGSRRHGGGRRSLIMRVVLLVVVVVLGLSASASVVERFSGGGESVVTTESVLDEARDRTFVGGSKFVTQPISSPIDVPYAIVSVVMRPFPWEAVSVPGLMSALESVLFVWLAWSGRRGISHFLGNLWRRPYLVFAMTYSMAFIVAFSNISNAGLLARQRTQLFPLLLVIVVLSERRWWDDTEDSGPVSGPARPFATSDRYTASRGSPLDSGEVRGDQEDGNC